MPPGGADALAQQHQLARLDAESFTLLQSTLYRYRITDGRPVAAVVRALEVDSRVAAVQPNYLFALQEEVSTAGAGSGMGGLQYVLEKLRLAEAHRVARGEATLVAVIDSGIDVTHPELSRAIADSFDPLGIEDAPHAHGTAVAGAIAARGQLTGVAPGTRILGVRAFAPGAEDTAAQGTTYHILKGLDWAHGKGARVANLSFAGPRDPMLSRMLAAASGKGMILVAAAGNAGPKSPPLYPAADASVIAVTATDAGDKLYSAANRGDHIAVSAPGVDILLPAPKASYEISSGTSIAAAHVSGIAALMLELSPELGPDDIRESLGKAARDLGGPGRDELFGSGLVDAFEAVRGLTRSGPAEVQLTSGSQP